jgi:hypothetical protein
MTRSVFLLALALLGVSAARGQGDNERPGPVCTLPVDPDGLHEHAHPVARAASPKQACAAAQRTATFAVTFVGFPADAQAAFRAALDTWACRIASDIPIRVHAEWKSLATGTLGNAGPYLYRNFNAAPQRDTWYPAALADHYAGQDLNTGQPDIQAEFNSDFDAWHLDADAPPPADRYDFYTVVLHEIGHGLGFIGAMTVQDGRGLVGAAGGARGPYAFDRYTEDTRGVPLLDASVYPDNSVALGAVLRSGVVFDGPAVARVQVEPARLYTPAVWSSGGSYSHLDEARFASAGDDALMTPFIGRGETYEAPGAVTCAILFDIGWTLAGACLEAVGDLPRSTDRISLALAGPNPFLRETAVTVRAPTARRVRVALADPLGREVAVLWDGPLGAGEDVRLAVPARGLAAGVYRVVAQGGGEVAAQPVVLLR